ncbi:DUF459 domain-containing protein [Undibacterium sp. CY7W]|uniref:DUF459 domain-containing protein n=1 Tax=Undibacterium rugosum TaxID=2762291 RepID=A0A923KZP0_9BURK|nr:SGNH family hydrolase [Undibacterium rugosum]MBC3935436.1 DUF459 domain-containing protein [Undibacterium rugosum]
MYFGDHPERKPQPATVLRVLSLLGSSLVLIAWLRQDALDLYWQQTRHAELGLSTAIPHAWWRQGPVLSAQLESALQNRLSGAAEIQQRMVLAANVLLYGKAALSEQDFVQVSEPVIKSSAQAGLSLKAHAQQLGTLSTVQTETAARRKENDSTGADAAVSAANMNPEAAPASVSHTVSAQLAQADSGDSEELPAVTQFARLADDGRIVLSKTDRVLLVGDSMMQGVAPHLARALQNVQVKALDVSKQSTGLTYPNYFDWPGRIRELIPKEKISILVIFMGANDTWDMVLGGKYEPFGSETWRRLYAERVAGILNFAHSQHVRVLWLGAPNMGKDNIQKGVPVLNQLYAGAMKDGTSRYLSTREILSDKADEYQRTITGKNGEQIVVRSGDGVHFTRDGHKLITQLVMRQFVLPQPANTEQAQNDSATQSLSQAPRPVVQPAAQTVSSPVSSPLAHPRRKERRVLSSPVTTSVTSSSSS